MCVRDMKHGGDSMILIHRLFSQLGLGIGLVCMVSSFSAIAGAPPTEPGVTAHTIVIGQSAGFTGPVSDSVKQLTEGAKLYFDLINKQGGVFDRKIVLESIDDGYDAKRAFANTSKLINDSKVFALFLYRGTPTTEAAIPLLTSSRVPLIAPVTGAESLHQPMNRYLFNVRAKYGEEVNKVVEQLYSMGLKRFAAFSPLDAFGVDGENALRTAIKKNNLPDPLIIHYERNAADVQGYVSSLVAAKPQAIMMFCTPKPCALFISAFRKAGGTQQLVTLSNVSTPDFISSLGDNSRGLGFTQVFPDPTDSTVPISKELITALASRRDLSNSYQLMEGFISAKVLVEGLRRCGPIPTREKLITALESMGGLDMGGLKLNYGPNSRDGSNFIELTVIGQGGHILK